MIVVDLGCAEHPPHEDESTTALLERFRPAMYYGFDPHPSVVERDRWIGPTRTVIQRKAAWIFDGTVGYVSGEDVVNPLGSRVGESSPYATPVECFDLAPFLTGLVPAAAGELVLKLDVEGAEYPLLEHLIGQGVDRMLTLVSVEWHEIDGGSERELEILKQLRCAVEEW